MKVFPAIQEMYAAAAPTMSAENVFILLINPVDYRTLRAELGSTFKQTPHDIKSILGFRIQQVVELIPLTLVLKVSEAELTDTTTIIPSR